MAHVEEAPFKAQQLKSKSIRFLLLVIFFKLDFQQKFFFDFDYPEKSVETTHMQFYHGFPLEFVWSGHFLLQPKKKSLQEMVSEDREMVGLEDGDGDGWWIFPHK